MTKEYWLNRWERSEIGFHQDQFNPYLMEYWSQLQVSDNNTVFVPLCGKSRDMIWLQNRGHSVLGVEFSRLAVTAFFQENEVTPSHQAGQRFI